jgi:diketogulonate reductase-like aldo/keto reductase
LQEQGVIRNIGVSNFTARRLEYAQTLSSHKIVVNQVHYNLVNREPEAGLLEYCREHDVMLDAWRPLEKGGIFSPTCELITQMCRKYGKTPAQIAINWLISQPNVVTMSTMRSPAHLDDNLGSVGWTMATEDIELLRRDFPGQQAVSAVVPLM